MSSENFSRQLSYKDMSSVEREAPDVFYTARRQETDRMPLVERELTCEEFPAVALMLTENFMSGMLEDGIYQSGVPEAYQVVGSQIECGFTVKGEEGGVKYGDLMLSDPEAVKFVYENYLSPHKAPVTFLGDVVSTMGRVPEAFAGTSSAIIDAFDVDGEFSDYVSMIEQERDGILMFPRVDDFGAMRYLAGRDLALGHICEQDFESVMRLTEVDPCEIGDPVVIGRLEEAGGILLRGSVSQEVQVEAAD